MLISEVIEDIVDVGHRDSRTAIFGSDTKTRRDEGSKCVIYRPSGSNWLGQSLNDLWAAADSKVQKSSFQLQMLPRA